MGDIKSELKQAMAEKYVKVAPLEKLKSDDASSVVGNGAQDGGDSPGWVWKVGRSNKKTKAQKDAARRGYYAEFMAETKYANLLLDSHCVKFMASPNEIQLKNFSTIYAYRNELNTDIKKLNGNIEVVKLRGVKIGVGSNGMPRLTGGDLGSQTLVLLRSKWMDGNNKRLFALIDEESIYFYVDAKSNIRIVCKKKDIVESGGDEIVVGPQTRNGSVIVVRKIWGSGGTKW